MLLIFHACHLFLIEKIEHIHTSDIRRTNEERNKQIEHIHTSMQHNQTDNERIDNGLDSYTFPDEYTEEQRKKLRQDAISALATAKGITGRQHRVVDMKIVDEGQCYVSVTMIDSSGFQKDPVSH